MKKTPLIRSVVAALVAAAAPIIALCPKGGAKPAADGEALTASAGDIVYVHIDSLILKYDMYSAKKQAIESDLNKKGRKLESDGKAFENQINKGLLTRSAAEKQQQTLLQRQQDLQNLASQKQAELMEENEVMMNQVMDAITTYLERYNETHNFAAILTTSATTNVVIVGNPALDITAEIVEGLNSEYIKKRNR